MLKIDSKTAYLYLDEIDIKVLENELTDLRNSIARQKRYMTEKYYLEDSRTILMLVYWEDDKVAEFRFKTNEVVR